MQTACLLSVHVRPYRPTPAADYPRGLARWLHPSWFPGLYPVPPSRPQAPWPLSFVLFHGSRDARYPCKCHPSFFARHCDDDLVSFLDQLKVPDDKAGFMYRLPFVLAECKRNLKIEKFEDYGKSGNDSFSILT